MGRPVEIFDLTPYEFGKPRKKISVGRGEFHQWGESFQEDEEGFTGYTIAIVELPDGSVSMISPDLIKFLDVK